MSSLSVYCKICLFLLWKYFKSASPGACIYFCLLGQFCISLLQLPLEPVFLLGQSCISLLQPFLEPALLPVVARSITSALPPLVVPSLGVLMSSLSPSMSLSSPVNLSTLLLQWVHYQHQHYNALPNTNNYVFILNTMDIIVMIHKHCHHERDHEFTHFNHIQIHWLHFSPANNTCRPPGDCLRN